jgi:hypothetical protein
VQCGGLPLNGTGATVNQFTGATGAVTEGNYRQNSKEQRHYIGIDARLTQGPLYLDPTFIYMTSSADVYRNLAIEGFGTVNTTTLVAGLAQGFGPRVTQNTSGWLLDIRGGYRVGPVLVEGIVMWSPGDDAQNDNFKKSHLYHAINVDNAYGGAWSEILAGGSVDYFTGSASAMTENHGLGRYGMRRVGSRLTYSVTPAFDVNMKWQSAWSDTKVDIDAPAGSAVASSFGAVPCANRNGGLVATATGATVGAATAAGAAARACLASPYGEKTYIGTEIDAGLTYRFAPGLTFDAVYGHLFAGSALDTSYFDNVATSAVETSTDTIVLAINRAGDFLEKTLGADANGWRWGRLHTATLYAPLFENLGNAQNEGPFANDGGKF